MNIYQIGPYNAKVVDVNRREATIVFEKTNRERTFPFSCFGQKPKKDTNLEYVIIKNNGSYQGKFKVSEE